MAHASQSREFLEVSSGKGFVGTKDRLLGGWRTVFTTGWVDVKIRPFTEQWQWESIGMHFGVHQSDDFTKNAACRVAPSIAGRIYCSTAGEEWEGGARFTAIYTGLQAELVELLRREPKPLQLYVSGGASLVQSVITPSSILPYSAFEVAYQVRRSVKAKAALYVSVPRDSNDIGVAAPEVSLEYRF